MPVEECDRIKLTHRINQALYRADAPGDLKIGPIGISSSTADYIFNSFRGIGTFSTDSYKISNIVPVNYEASVSTQWVRKIRLVVNEVSMTLDDPGHLDFLLGRGWHSVPTGESHSSLLNGYANTVVSGSDVIITYCIETNDIWIQLTLEQTRLSNRRFKANAMVAGYDAIGQENNHSGGNTANSSYTIKRRRRDVPTKVTKF